MCNPCKRTYESSKICADSLISVHMIVSWVRVAESIPYSSSTRESCIKENNFLSLDHFHYIEHELRTRTWTPFLSNSKQVFDRTKCKFGGHVCDTSTKEVIIKAVCFRNPRKSCKAFSRVEI